MNADVARAGLGEILHWPQGYAMTLGRDRSGNNVTRCCDGHDTPQDARNHGLARLLETALAVSDQHLAAWASVESETS